MNAVVIGGIRLGEYVRVDIKKRAADLAEKGTAGEPRARKISRGF